MTAAGQKQILVTVLACIVGGIIAYLQYSLPKSDPKALIDREWTLPNTPDNSATVNAYKALSQYFQITPQGTHASGQQSGQKKVSAWTLQGMLQQGSEQYALIKSNSKITRYRIGERLPDMSILTAINNNGITIELAGKTQAITLHGGKRK